MLKQVSRVSSQIWRERKKIGVWIFASRARRDWIDQSYLPGRLPELRSRWWYKTSANLYLRKYRRAKVSTFSLFFIPNNAPQSDRMSTSREEPAIQQVFRCQHPRCGKLFNRRENLSRHLKTRMCSPTTIQLPTSPNSIWTALDKTAAWKWSSELRARLTLLLSSD